MIIKALTCMKYFSMRVKPNKKPQVPFRIWQIVRGDEVQVRAGRDRKKVGKVLKVYRKSNSVIVEGVNLRTKKFSKHFILFQKHKINN